MISLVTLRSAEGTWRWERVAALLRARAQLLQANPPPVCMISCEAGANAVSSVRAAVLDGEGDAAVHWAEDLPGLDHEKLEVIAIPPRSDPREALYSRNGASFAQLGRGARVGAAGLLRVAQLAELRPDLAIVALDEGPEAAVLRVGRDLDAVVMPELALARLARPASDHFAVEDLVPGVGRGTIALEARAGHRPMLPQLAELDDPRSRLQWMAERVVSRRLQAWPAANLGAVAEVTYGSVTVHAALVTCPRAPVIRAHRSGPAGMARQVADAVASALLLQEESSGSDASWP